MPAIVYMALGFCSEERLPLPKRHWYVSAPDAPVVASVKFTDNGIQPEVALAVKSAFSAADDGKAHSKAHSKNNSGKLDFKRVFLIS